MDLDTQLRVGRNLIFLRKSVKLSQCVFADYIEVSRTSYSQYEQGERLPDVHTIHAICNFYHLKIDTLLSTDLWKAANNFLLYQDHINDERQLLTLYQGLSEESKLKLTERAEQLVALDAERQKEFLPAIL